MILIPRHPYYRYVKVLVEDNEENAEIALKTLIEMQKYYKTACDVLVSFLINWHIS